MTHDSVSAQTGSQGSSAQVETILVVRGVTIRLVVDLLEGWLNVYTSSYPAPVYAKDISTELRQADVEAIHEVI